MTTKVKEQTEAIVEPQVNRGDVAVFQKPRLPYHEAINERYQIDRGGWKVLVEATFPLAKTVDSVVMALAYCKSRNLDIFKRPIHIVPMWNSAANNGRGAMVETVWPSISELRTTAFRTGNYAGKSATVFGPMKTETFKGVVKGYQDRPDKNIEATVTFPEWAQITLTRVLGGVKCEFVGPMTYWMESYGRQGKTDVPNDMWQKRPSGQIEKVAEAAALRVAFPEEIGNEYAAEEMEGQRILDPAEHARDVTPKDQGPPPPPPAAEPPAPPTAPVSDIVAQPESPKPIEGEILPNPEVMLAEIKATLDAITDPYEVAQIWEEKCLPKLQGAFPPDFETAQGYLRAAEKRLDP